jgi:hypothetical protein
LARFEFESRIVLFCFSFIFVSFGESCLLVSCCAAGRCSMACSVRIMVGVGDLVQKIENGRTCRILGGRTIERSAGTICGLHRANGDKEREFLG